MVIGMNNFLRGMLQPVNPYASIILGLLTNLWGTWLLLPHDAFDSAPLYNKMSEFAPEWAWGAWAFVCGMLIILSVLKANWRWLSFAMGFATWHWSTVSGMMWWSDWHNTGGLTYTFISAYAAYLYLNIRINHIKV